MKFITYAIGVLVLWIAPVHAQQTFTILVQDYRSLPPYSIYEDNEYSGFNRELLDMFADVAGYTFEYEALPVRRLFVEFSEGRGDFKYPDNAAWASHIKGDAPIVYSQPVVDFVNGVMVQKDTLGKDVKELSKLGIVAGWTPVGYQDQIKSGQIDLLENNSYEGLLKQAILGRIDGAYSNVATSRFYLAKLLGEPGSLVFDPDLPHVRSYRSLSTLKHPEIIAAFDAFLVDQASAIEALKEKYGVEDGI